MRTLRTLLPLLVVWFGLAFFASAQSAATAPPQPAEQAQPVAAHTITPQERELAVKELQRTRDGFLKSIDGLSEAQWKFKPAPDRWSIAEVAEHIAVSEDTIFGMTTQKLMKAPAQTPMSAADALAKDQLILTKVPDRSRKAQAPEILKPTGRWANREELTKVFEHSRANTIDYANTTQEDLRSHIGPHPVLKDLDAYQWLLLISAHSERHTAQINEVKQDPNYPKE